MHADSDPSPSASSSPTPPPLPGRVAEDISTLGAVLDALLKRPDALLDALAGERAGGVIARLVAVIVMCAGVYGVVMGSLSGGAQLWAAPAKLVIGFLLSIALCLPSLAIFLCLNGADLRPRQIAGALLGMVALVTLLLVGFAPVAWIFSQSTDSVVMMGVLHLLFWVIGLWFGVRILKGLLANAESRATDQGHLKVWIVIFTLVSLQMTSVLRPLVGTADTLLPTEKKFFVQHWTDNLNR